MASKKKTAYKVGMVVAFGGYAKDTAEEDKDYEVGELVELVSDDDSGTKANPAFLARAKDDHDKQAYVFASELGEPVKEKQAPAKSKAKETAKKKAVAEKKAPAKKAVAKKQTKKVAPVKTTEVEVKIKHATSVAKLVKGGGASVLKEAKAVANRIGSDFYTLGGLLSEIKSMSYFEVLKGEDGQTLMGQKGFEEYIRAELGIEYRMAMHFVNVYQVTRQAGIAESKVKHLKCSKVVQLLGLIREGAITKANWDEWMGKATELKGNAYKEVVEQAQVDAGITKKQSRGVTANQVRFSFVLFDDRAKVANKALELAKESMEPNADGSETSNSDAFDFVLSEWATSQA